MSRRYPRDSSNLQRGPPNHYEYIPEDRGDARVTPRFVPDPPPIGRRNRSRGVGFETPYDSDVAAEGKGRPRGRYRPPTPPPSDFFEEPGRHPRYVREEVPPKNRNHDYDPYLATRWASPTGGSRDRKDSPDYDRLAARRADRRSAPHSSRVSERGFDPSADPEPQSRRGARHPPTPHYGQSGRPYVGTYARTAPQTRYPSPHSPARDEHRDGARKPAPSPPPAYAARRISPTRIDPPKSSSHRRRDFSDDDRRDDGRNRRYGDSYRDSGGREKRRDVSPEPRSRSTKTPSAAAAAGARPSISRSKTTRDKAATWLSDPRLRNAAAAAFQAGAMTAFESRGGSKKAGGARIATAALGAAALDAFGNNRGAKEASTPMRARGSAKNELGAAVGGLLAEQIGKRGSRRAKR
ncbi:hypothetical protein VTK73DRAFT_912 [Phialemonium thermophilum]|uniref:Uncharacterized protein n=1 Tax=Phialemonium thermophilum TaxID=223376 RepID=A0ABR3XCW0_9PEZI